MILVFEGLAGYTKLGLLVWFAIVGVLYHLVSLGEWILRRKEENKEN